MEREQTAGDEHKPTRGSRFSAAVLVVGLGAIGALLWGCQAAAGMFCQQQSECRVGLVCEKPPGPVGEGSFGVCAPARRGDGESCMNSDDCQSGLRCSIELGMDNGDERHGICVTVDAGTGAPDMSGSSDQGSDL